MAVQLEIVPLSNTLDMFGDPDRSSAYSVAGHVAIHLRSSYSLFDRRRMPTRVALQSLRITFDGQSEIITPDTGYQAYRLCSVSRELAPSDYTEFSNEGHELSDKPCTWNVVFNLPIPGWLPASVSFGETQGGPAGVRYHLHATARFVSLDEPQRSFFFSTLCAPFAQKTRRVRASPCAITVARAMVRPSSSPSGSMFPAATYLVDSVPDKNEQSTGAGIPVDVLKKLQVVVGVPEHVSLGDENDLPVTLRLRMDDSAGEDCKRIRISDFQVEIEQAETYRSDPSTAYTTRFPVPPASDQPPSRPLLVPHPASTLYNLGITDIPNTSVTRSFSLLPESHCGTFVVKGDGYLFRDAQGDQKRWFVIDTRVPYDAGKREEKAQRHWTNARDIRPSAAGPHFNVGHKLLLQLRCTYDLDEQEAGTPQRGEELLRFSIPLSFVHVCPSVAPRCARLSAESMERLSEDADEDTPLMVEEYASTPPLPAYSQLFYTNGDRRTDGEEDLPLYTA